MEREVAQARAAFLMAIQTIGKIRNMTMVWRRGEETQRLKEIGKITSKTLADIQELIYKSTEEMNGSDAVGNSQSGGI
jgi:16S rRNA G527 N7-methylase RsmG